MKGLKPQAEESGLILWAVGSCRRYWSRERLPPALTQGKAQTAAQEALLPGLLMYVSLGTE